MDRDRHLDNILEINVTATVGLTSMTVTFE